MASLISVKNTFFYLSSFNPEFEKVRFALDRWNFAIALLTQDQKCFTVSEVAADLHALMIPQRSMQTSIACLSEQLDPRFAVSRHTTAPISHIRLSPRSPYATTYFPFHGG